MDAGALEAIVSKQVITALKAHDAVRHRHSAADQERAEEQGHWKRAPLTQAESEQACHDDQAAAGGSQILSSYTNGKRPGGLPRLRRRRFK